MNLASSFFGFIRIVMRSATYYRIILLLLVSDYTNIESEMVYPILLNMTTIPKEYVTHIYILNIERVSECFWISLQ